jgi:hypothetical protein
MSQPTLLHLADDRRRDEAASANASGGLPPTETRNPRRILSMASRTSSKTISLAPSTGDKALSKTQKQFNALLKKLEAEKKALLEWQETLPEYHRRLADEYDAQWDAYNDLRIDLLNALDGACENERFGKADKRKIGYLVTTIAAELIAEHGKDELKELHDKYSDRAYDAIQKETASMQGEQLKSMLSSLFGIEAGDDVNIDSPEKLEEFMQEKLRDVAERHEEQRRRAEERRSRRKKTPKQLEKDMKERQAEQDINRSIREVYRQLTSELHPDREQDVAERERKTEIMQRVNVAYAKKDLIKLLELQLEIEQIDQEHLQNIAEERLKYCNKLLRQQIDELAREIALISQPFKMQLELLPFMPLTPKQLMQHLERDLRDVKQDIARLKRDLTLFRDPKVLKEWIKKL